MRKRKTTFVVVDRYTGIGHNGCRGPCEGMGVYPKKDPKNPKADEIGYVWIKCEVCRDKAKG